MIEPWSGQIYYENVAAIGSVSLTTGVNGNVDSGGGSPIGIPLPAGTWWDLQAALLFSPGATTSVTRLEAFIGTATGDNTTGRDNLRGSAYFATAANVIVYNTGSSLQYGEFLYLQVHPQQRIMQKHLPSLQSAQCK